MKPIYKVVTRNLSLNPPFFLGALLALTAAQAHAQSLLYVETFTNSPAAGAIPEGSPLGVAFTGAVSDVPAGFTVGSLTLDLNVSGGLNGNLYAYLESPGGTLVELMDRPGVSEENPFGASGPGMNITLQDSGASNGSIQDETSASVLTGSYNPAGTLADFDGLTVDGAWELFFADLVSGGGTSTVNSWALTVTVVPEPGIPDLEILGGILLALGLMAHGKRPTGLSRRDDGN